MTDSAAKAGIVAFARMLPLALFALPAGLAADRRSRKRLMIAADGFLLGAVSARATIAVFAGFGVALAVWGTLSPSIRAAPSLDELAEPPDPGTSPATAG